MWGLRHVFNMLICLSAHLVVDEHTTMTMMSHGSFASPNRHVDLLSRYKSAVQKVCWLLLIWSRCFVVRKYQARSLLKNTHAFYLEDSKFAHVKTFNKDPQSFDYKAVLRAVGMATWTSLPQTNGKLLFTSRGGGQCQTQRFIVCLRWCSLPWFSLCGPVQSCEW